MYAVIIVLLLFYDFVKNLIKRTLLSDVVQCSSHCNVHMDLLESGEKTDSDSVGLQLEPVVPNFQ